MGQIKEQLSDIQATLKSFQNFLPHQWMLSNKNGSPLSNLTTSACTSLTLNNNINKEVQSSLSTSVDLFSHHYSPSLSMNSINSNLINFNPPHHHRNAFSPISPICTDLVTQSSFFPQPSSSLSSCSFLTKTVDVLVPGSRESLFLPSSFTSNQMVYATPNSSIRPLLPLKIITKPMDQSPVITSSISPSLLSFVYSPVGSQLPINLTAVRPGISYFFLMIILFCNFCVSFSV